MKKVFIGPNTNLNLQDFAQIYGGEGATPADAASNIHMNFPTEAQSVMSRSWRNLGIQQAPEQYFASVAKGASMAPSTVMAPTADRWPVFQNEVDRNIAIDAGVYDPTYASPLQKKRAQALEAIALAKNADFRRTRVAQAPTITELDDPAKLEAYQLAGDNGAAKKILFDLNAVGRQVEGPQLSYSDWLAKGGGNVGPYQPKAGFGALETTTSPTRLDSNLYYNPEFQKELQRNPEQANFIYERMTGRRMDSDIKEHLDLRKSQIDVGRKYAAEQLQNGAVRDPQTGNWTVLNVADAPISEGGIQGLTGGSPRPFKQFVPATQQQKSWLDTHAPAITGNQLEPLNSKGQGEAQMRLQQLQNNPLFQQHKATREAQLRRSLNNDEILHLVDEVKSREFKDQQDPSKIPWYMKLAAINDSAVTSLAGIDPNSDPANPEKAAWLKWILGEDNRSIPEPAVGSRMPIPSGGGRIPFDDPQVRKILGY